MQKFSDPYCGSYKTISLGHKGLLKTPVFWKKGYLSSEEEISAYFSSFNRGLRTSGSILLGSKRFFDNHCAIHIATSTGPTSCLETNLSKKR